MTWSIDEAREAEYRERVAYHTALRCRDCGEQYIGEVFEGQPDECPICDSEEIERA